MFQLPTAMRAALAASLLLALLPSAHAEEDSSGNMNPYNMCIRAADAPKPDMEWDLKGNAKLPAYCKCFTTQFNGRLNKYMAYLAAHGGQEPPTTPEKTNAEELAMRNSCRKQLGLPAATPDAVAK